jgi:hypothetical protein
MTSNAPPAAKGTTIVNGRVGQSCAAAGAVAATRAPTAAMILMLGTVASRRTVQSVALRSGQPRMLKARLSGFDLTHVGFGRDAHCELVEASCITFFATY